MKARRILELAEERRESTVMLRRAFHCDAEPSRGEINTQKRIIAELYAIGITEIKRYYNTGVVAVIRGGFPGKTIAIRADMDALPIPEETGLPFTSINDGVSHACGHDGHMAMLLGAASVLWTLKTELHGNIKLIFQPAEEDGLNGGGSQYMINEGVLTDEPKVDFIIGQHIAPIYPVGTIVSKPGPFFSTSDLFTIKVTGKGGHSAMPQNGRDPIVAAAQLILAIQSITSRSISPFDPVAISVCTINGGTRHNIIPDFVTLSGGARSFSEETSALLRRRMSEICAGTGKMMGVSAEVSFKKSYGPVINDMDMYARCSDWVRRVLGDKAFVQADEPQMSGEDFANFSAIIPGVYFLVGAKCTDRHQYPPHSGKFTFDEDALYYGIVNLCAVACGYLQDD